MIRKAMEMMEQDESLKDHRVVKKFEVALQQSKELVLETLMKSVQEDSVVSSNALSQSSSVLSTGSSRHYGENISDEELMGTDICCTLKNMIRLKC